jgi:hypothetical protein
LYERLQEENRLKDVPWEDMHFWSGAQRNLALEEHETLNLVEYGYRLMNETWGPSMLRRLDVQLNGYRFCRDSDNPLLRDHRARFFKKQCGVIWTLVKAMARFAPNGEVRRKAHRIDDKYRAIIGEPTATMKVLANTVEMLATLHHAREVFEPNGDLHKEEPFKRYVYSRSNDSNGKVPYTTEWPGRPSIKTRLSMLQEEVKYAMLDKALRGVKIGLRKQYDPEIDDYLQGMVRRRAFGFGL